MADENRLRDLIREVMEDQLTSVGQGGVVYRMGSPQRRKIIEFVADVIVSRARPTDAGTHGIRGADPALETEVAWLLAREQGKGAPPLSPETAASYERLQGLLAEMANAPVEPSPGWQERVLSSISSANAVQPICAVHFGAVHGGEAEELRRGIERIIAQSDYRAVKGQLIRLLDSVDARDSLAHVEELDALKARVADLEERQQKHLELIRRLSQETPLASEAEGWTSQRAALVAEVGTLKARVAELERDLNYLAILRAIWPAFITACDEVDTDDDVWWKIIRDVNFARSALTPELRAVAKAAGLPDVP